MLDKRGGLLRLMAHLIRISAVMLVVSYGAKFAAGYIARGWERLRRKKNLSVDVIAPHYGPALVVSTDDFDDDINGAGKVLEDGYHTQTFRRLAWLETVRHISVAVSLIVLTTALAIGLRLRRSAPEERDVGL